MRLQILSGSMHDQIKRWLLGFTFHHAVQFPPFHKVRAPFVRIRNCTLGQVFFTFRSTLTWWTPDDEPQCQCHLFPLAIQQRPRKTEHISAFAHECYPDESIFQEHMAEEIAPSWTSFLHHNTYQFEQWLIRWKLPHSLIQYWQDFLRTLWDEFKKTPQGQSQRHIRNLQHKLSSFVVSPSDHFPHSLTLHCPVQWKMLMKRTFLDPTVFTQCSVLPVPLLRTIQQELPSWILEQYKWGFKFTSSQHCLHPSQTFARLSESTPNCGLLQRLVSDLG